MSTNYSELLKIETEYSDEQLDRLETHKVITEKEVEIAVNLINHYNYKKVTPSFILKIARAPLKGMVELLYGPAVPVKGRFCILEPKAAIVFVRTKDELVLARFAHEPWFEESLAVAWANYRIEQAKEHFGIKYVSWLVDEHNLSLQLTLKKHDYLASSVPAIKSILKFVK